MSADRIKIKINKNTQDETKEENKQRDNIFKDLSFGQIALAAGITIAAFITAPFIEGYMLIKALGNESKSKKNILTESRNL